MFVFQQQKPITPASRLDEIRNELREKLTLPNVFFDVADQANYIRLHDPNNKNTPSNNHIDEIIRKSNIIPTFQKALFNSAILNDLSTATNNEQFDAVMSRFWNFFNNFRNSLQLNDDGNTLLGKLSTGKDTDKTLIQLALSSMGNMVMISIHESQVRSGGP